MGAYPYIEEIVNRVLGDKKIGYTVFAANVLQDKLYQKAEPKTGSLALYPIAKNKTGTAKKFTIYGASDTATYVQNDQTQMLSFDWTVSADFLRLSNIQAAMASGPEALIDFIKGQVEIVTRSLRDLVSDDIFNGTGAAPDAAGLSTILSYSPTYGGKTRTDFPALIPVRVSANDVNQVLGSATGTLVFTLNSTIVTAGTASLPITDVFPGGFLTGPDGRRYKVLENSATQIRIFPAYQGTSVTSSSWTYTGFFYPSSVYGNAGELTLKKINKVMSFCTDGNDLPTDIVSSSGVHNFFLNAVIDKGFNVNGEVRQIGLQKVNVLTYNGTEVYIDNHIPSDTLYVLNLNYIHLTPLKGYEKIQLSKDGMYKDTSGTRVASLVGEVVATYAIGCNGVNRQGCIVDIQTV
jgi:hypothetical protein